jgi:hypothetical protein
LNPLDRATALAPNAKELAVLRIFVSTDETRPNLATLYAYESDGGTTYVATDGHTIVVRRAGTHRTMALHDVFKLATLAVGDDGTAKPTDRFPPKWEQVLRAGATGGALAKAYSISPLYMMRLADVEKAAGQRAADDYVPPAGLSKKDAAAMRANLKGSALTLLTIPSDPLDGWFWKAETTAALWEGVVMPRRI